MSVKGNAISLGISPFQGRNPPTPSLSRPRFTLPLSSLISAPIHHFLVEATATTTAVAASGVALYNLPVHCQLPHTHTRRVMEGAVEKRRIDQQDYD